MAKKGGEKPENPSTTTVIYRPVNETRGILTKHLGYTSKKEFEPELFKGTKYGMWKAVIAGHEKGTWLKLTHLDNPEMPDAHHFTSPASFIGDELEDIKKAMWRTSQRKTSRPSREAYPEEKKPVVDVDATMGVLSFYLGETDSKSSNESFIDDAMRLLPYEVKASLEKIDDPKLIQKCTQVQDLKELGETDKMRIRGIIRHLTKELNKPKIHNALGWK